jgi:DNA-binding HxlR family transcriptional regulator
MAKIQPNAFLAECPSRGVLSRVGEKWSLLLLAKLAQGPTCFGELRRSVEGISQKMLTQSLRSLERDGLVKRRSLDVRPVRVEYSLTSLGLGLLPLIRPIKAWAERNLFAIEKRNADFDQARANELRKKTRSKHGV